MSLFDAETVWTTVTTREQVTEEILDLIRGVESGWYAEGRIDWEDVWDRVESSELADGTRLDWGTEIDTAAMRHIKRVINRERREG